jgi:hypothetical protein
MKFLILLLLSFNTAMAAIEVPYYCKVYELNEFITVFDLEGSVAKVEIDNPTNTRNMTYAHTDTTVILNHSLYQITIYKNEDPITGTFVIKASGASFDMTCEADVLVGR